MSWRAGGPVAGGERIHKLENHPAGIAHQHQVLLVDQRRQEGIYLTTVVQEGFGAEKDVYDVFILLQKYPIINLTLETNKV